MERVLFGVQLEARLKAKSNAALHVPNASDMEMLLALIHSLVDDSLPLWSYGARPCHGDELVWTNG